MEKKVRAAENYVLPLASLLISYKYGFLIAIFLVFNSNRDMKTLYDSLLHLGFNQLTSLFIVLFFEMFEIHFYLQIKGK